MLVIPFFFTHICTNKVERDIELDRDAISIMNTNSIHHILLFNQNL